MASFIILLFKVPGIASNILRNKSALVMVIRITFACFQTLRPRKQDFSLPHRYHFDSRSSSELKEPRFRLLEIEAKAVIYIHTYMLVSFISLSTLAWLRRYHKCGIVWGGLSTALMRPRRAKQYVYCLQLPAYTHASTYLS